MSKEPVFAEQNSILRALSHARYGKLFPQMQPVTLPAGTILYDAGQPIKHVYFPRTALISLVGVTADGRGTEVAMIGSEGFLGIPVLLGALSQPYEATIQISGHLWKLRKEALESSHDDAASFSRLLYRYAAVRLTQISQSAICNRFHSLKQRLCRWLLTAGDRTKSKRLELTQEFLSQMIGARRPATAKTLGLLRLKRIIGGERGSIIILSQTALEAAACDCYQSAKEELETYQRGQRGMSP